MYIMLQDVTDQPIGMETECFSGRVEIEQLEESHPVLEKGGFADVVLADFGTYLFRGFVALICIRVTVDGSGQLGDGSFVQDGAKSAVGNSEGEG